MAHPLSRRRLLTLGTATFGALTLGPHAQAAAPTSLALPDGWQPEGITIGAGPYAYLGSLVDGSLYRADLRTGTGKVISTGPGTPAVGLKLDPRGRLFVAARSFGARVVDARSGETLASYTLATAAPSFANDIVLTPRAAWFTESYQPVLYGLPLGRNGELPAAGDVVRLPLTGDWVQSADGAINANGIARTPDGSALLVVQAGVGLLHRVDPATGITEAVDLGDAAPLVNGDGLLVRGRTLYAVQNRQNAIDVFRLAADGRSGVFQRRITDPAFDVPTTVAAYGGRLYLPNARFTTTPTSETTYSVTAVGA
ncbi:SMP-30/gluconolactonase/LRE family protein [Streptomyces hyaluromycini]|uniref:SMP-30/gluconolactonase/LRE family protein n=1 Tax=Streptomyces hyaluromycini TaxID=1377993 RepID=UPI000B5CFF57|nr:superoxide dismutase [Streptomyces hyaluromycini]